MEARKALILIALPSIIIWGSCILGCGGGAPTRTQVAEMLDKGKKEENLVEFELDKNLPIGNEEEAPYLAAAKSGYLGLNDEANTASISPKSEQLVKDGKWRLSSCPARPQYKCLYIPIASQAVREITGIMRQEKEAHVEFTWRWQLTPVGEELAKNGLDYKKPNAAYSPFDTSIIYKGDAELALYDDGWRVTEVHWSDTKSSAVGGVPNGSLAEKQYITFQCSPARDSGGNLDLPVT